MSFCINQFIESQENHIIEDLKALIEIPSISLRKEPVNDALRWVISRGKAFGLEARTVLDDKVGIIELGSGEETIGILTHVDVVGVEDLKEWNTEPFKGVLLDQCIYGRGAIDDKGPLIACLYAMRAIKESGKELHKKIQMIIGTQEETEWEDIRAYVENYEVPDYGFTPDGEFPITNIEKGYVDVRVSFRKEEGEDWDKSINLIGITGGSAINVIPGKCQGTLRGNTDLIKEAVRKFNLAKGKEFISLVQSEENITVTARGCATHSCFPEKGLNAIVLLCNFLSEIPLKDEGKGNLVKFIKDVFTENGDLIKFGLKQDSEYKNGEYIHKTVASPTIVHCDEVTDQVFINFRSAYGTSLEDIKGCFEKFQEIYNYDFEIMETLEPTYVSKDCKFLSALAESYEKNSGFKNEFLLAHGASYAKAMPMTVAFGPIFPGEVDCCHEANEFISKENLIKITKIYAGALENMVFSRESFK